MAFVFFIAIFLHEYMGVCRILMREKFDVFFSSFNKTCTTVDLPVKLNSRLRASARTMLQTYSDFLEKKEIFFSTDA